MQSLQTPPSSKQLAERTPAQAPAKTDRGGRWADMLLITFFWGVLLAFGAGTWLLPQEQVSESENREFASAPKLPAGKLRWKNLITLPPQFEAFYSDRMVNRTHMVKSWNWMQYAWLGVSPSKTVAIGKNGYLFFLGDNSEPIIRREKPFSAVELSEWNKVLTYRTKVLKEHGIKYFFVAPPIKSSIYPEYLPKEWKPVHEESRLQQLSAYMKQNKEVAYLSLEPTLLANKNGPDLYYKTDTHWNAYGGFIGYHEMMLGLKKLFPQLEPISRDQLYFEEVPHYKGDEVKLMGLYGWIVDRAPVPRLKGSKPGDMKIIEPVDVSGKDRATGHEQPIPVFYNAPYKLNKVVFIHDSFGDGIKSYLASHFNQIVEMRQDDVSLDLDNILAQKPDLVIQQVVERHVSQFTPSMLDWRTWAVQVIQKHEPKDGQPVWLNIVPSTPEINVNRFVRVPRHHGALVNPTSPRLYSDKGDEVKFDPAKALYFQWYVLKDGDQGAGFRDPVSEQNYKHLCEYVRTSGHFEKIQSMNMLDHSELSLWHQK